MSAGIGLTLGVGASGKNEAPGASLSLGLDVSGQQSSYSQSQTYHTNTDVTAGGNVSVETGRNLALKGARQTGRSSCLRSRCGGVQMLERTGKTQSRGWISNEEVNGALI
ncbi:hemagglutinin repeat-containing protein [Labrenzia sp. ac12]|nr:hemagglutinin repeat-containing protein [Roseibium sp.]